MLIRVTGSASTPAGDLWRLGLRISSSWLLRLLQKKFSTSSLLHALLTFGSELMATGSMAVERWTQDIRRRSPPLE